MRTHLLAWWQQPVRAALLCCVSWDTAEEWRSMFFLPVCQCWSISVCGSDLWPAADKCVVMRQRAHWACCTPIINMESHTPPLHQPLFSPVSILEKKQNHTFPSFLLQLRNKIKDIVINLKLIYGLFCPSHSYLDLCFLVDLYCMLNFSLSADIYSGDHFSLVAEWWLFY